MQPESQVLVREFVRRLKAALNTVPNHVRLEAALEVESHVADVLSRRRTEESEAEQVAQILSGFGTPEVYARAFLSQVPETAAVTVGSGVKEIAVAGGDLFRGAFRLASALCRQGWALATKGSRRLHQGARWAAARSREAMAAARGPAAQVWDWGKGRAAFVGALAMAGGRQAVRLLRRVIREGRAMSFRIGGAAREGRHLAGRTVSLLGRALRWAVRAAALCLLGLFTLACFGLAAFAALAPDVMGWWITLLNDEVVLALTELRNETVHRIMTSNPGGYVAAGTAVMHGALVTGLMLTALMGFLIWHARRRNSHV